MSNILDELWYGNINPFEYANRVNPAVKDLIHLMDRNRESLCTELTDKQKEILEKYDDCMDEMTGICQREVFAYGFCLGTKIMLEVMLHDSDE